MRPAWRKGGLATGLASAVGLGAVAPAHAAPWEMRSAGGVDLGVRFGGGRPTRFVFGLQFMSVDLDHPGRCGGDAQLYAGGVARLEIAGRDDQRLLLGPVFGSTNGAVGWAADGAVGFAFGRDRGVLGTIGLEGSAAFFFDARAAVSSKGDGQVTGGLRAPPLSLSSSCVVGRPLRRHDGRAPLAGATHFAHRPQSGETPAGGDRAPDRDDDDQKVASADRADAARVWLERARLEWASVPAFLELARQLAACGAPAELLIRARAAAADELRHAVVSGALAAGFGDLHLLSLDPPSAAAARAAEAGAAGVVRLAVESFVDGCVGEAVAADQAAREAALASSPSIARAQADIADDEARHAALAWDVLGWTLAVDRRAVAPALREAAATVVTGSEPARARPRNLTRFGVLDDEGAQAVRDRRRARAAVRLSETLG